jgi:hypothetical protein
MERYWISEGHRTSRMSLEKGDSRKCNEDIGMKQTTSSHWRHQANLVYVIDPSFRTETGCQPELVVTEAVNQELVRLLDDCSPQKSRLSEHELETA